MYYWLRYLRLYLRHFHIRYMYPSSLLLAHLLNGVDLTWSRSLRFVALLVCHLFWINGDWQVFWCYLHVVSL